MSILLRAFCVASCFLTGIYYLTLFYLNNKSNHRKLWFPVLCFAFGINSIFRLSYHPALIFNPGNTLPLSDNFFFASLNISSLAMNLYNGFSFSKEKNLFFRLLNYACAAAAVFSLVVPSSFVLYFYLFSMLVCLASYIYGLYTAFTMYNTVSKTYAFSLVSYLLFISSVFPDVVLVILKIDTIGTRILIIPVFLLLHLVMLTFQYRLSLEHTKELSAALSDTIESINHSDNALKCTQMKPDFLYETLDLISNMCETDPFTAEDLTISLSKYLRHTLNFQQLKGIVPLSNELELTKAYVAIERERYKKIKFEYSFPESIPEVYVPPLSIQPLVENALEHGFKDINSTGKIKITIVSYNDYCHIDVSDNGVGIPEEMLAGLPASFAQTARIGLYNISNRLKNKFGNGLVIQSAEEVGTSISFTVPPEGKYNTYEGEDS